MKMQLGTEGRPISARIRTLKNSACFQSFTLLLKLCFCSLNKDHEQNLMPVSRTLNNRAVIKHFTTFSQCLGFELPSIHLKLLGQIKPAEAADYKTVAR